MFYSMLIDKVINLRKVKTKNLYFRTDVQKLLNNGWSVTQWTTIFRGR